MLAEGRRQRITFFGNEMKPWLAPLRQRINQLKHMRSGTITAQLPLEIGKCLDGDRGMIAILETRNMAFLNARILAHPSCARKLGLGRSLREGDPSVNLLIGITMRWTELALDGDNAFGIAPSPRRRTLRALTSISLRIWS